MRISDPQGGLFAKEFYGAERQRRMGNIRKGNFDPGRGGPRRAARSEDQREDAEEQDGDDKSQQEFGAIVFQPPEAYLENRPNHVFRIRMTKTKEIGLPR